MSEKCALFLTYHFAPSAASGTHRILGFVKFMPQFAWRTAVISPRALPFEPIDPNLLSSVPESTHLFQSEYPRGWMSWPVRRVSGERVWLPRAIWDYRKARKIASPNVIVTSGPPHCIHLAGYALKKMYGVPWVADFRDPWIAGRFTSISKLAKSEGTFWEPRVLAAADAIVVNAPNAKRMLQEAYPSLQNKIHVITNGFDAAQFDGLSAQQDNKLAISHIGELYAGRDPRMLLDTVKVAVEHAPQLRNRLVATFVGTSDKSAQQIGQDASQRGIADLVQCQPQVSYRESLANMVNAKVLVLLDTPQRRLGVPAKLYEYIGAKRPILSYGTTDSDVFWVLNSSGAPFRMCAPGDSAQSARALCELLDCDNTENHYGPSFDFSRESMARQLCNILNTVAK